MSSEFALGVIWYRTSDEKGSDHGGYVEYLEQGSEKREAFRQMDENLFDALYRIVHGEGDRAIEAVEKHILDEHVRAFHDNILPLDMKESHEERKHQRREWFQNARGSVEDCELVFLDPDNGLEVPSQNPFSRGGNRYVRFAELRQLLDRGLSAIVYQHGARGTFQNELKAKLRDFRDYAPQDTPLFAVTYEERGKRAFLFALQPQHEQLQSDMEDWVEGKPVFAYVETDE